MVKIVADENLSLVEHYFGKNNQLILKPGRTISRSDLMDADFLLVRSVTQVNEALLQGTAVKFVGSATSGTDHLDVKWLEQAGIAWAAAPGCNAEAVAEYVLCVIAALQKQGKLMQEKKRAAVIGVGHVGKKVVDILKKLNFDVLQCDPYRAEQEKDFPHVPLEKLTDLDFISLHTPLNQTEKYPTFHMINDKFLSHQKNPAVILNAGRGEVIDFKEAKKHAARLYFCLDVWENEPMIDREMLETALIATPHIAGYSIEGKNRGTEMIYHAAIQQGFLSPRQLPELNLPKKQITLSYRPVDWRDVVLAVFDPREITKELRSGSHDVFDQLRKACAARRELSGCELYYKNQRIEFPF